ncbi:MAG: hypothetical protein A2901_00720 [Elusimicrobia bacterium RIFCSPLOWO2_01_FULL_54_10]|nr:MAG: hypothetical protein A2901_00720 [Elusimicrobia bacterium RIFCSPLOWO2_01_FULL_54_10]
MKILGHEIIFVSDALHEPHGFQFYSLPIHRGNRSYWGRLQNIRSLRRIIEEDKVDLVHSHSRAANLIARFSNAPFVTTAHGRWRNTFAFRAFPCLGREAVAMCPYLERYLAEDIKISAEKISMIPNAIDTDRFAPGGKIGDFRTILYVGRFSGQKGKALRFLLDKVIGQVLNDFPDARFKIVADAPSIKDQELVRGLNGGWLVDSVEINGPAGDLTPLYRKTALVVGAGRVALEALACGKPVISIGESSAPGLLTESNFDDAFDSNFGDCGVWNLFLSQKDRLIRDFTRILGDDALWNKLSMWGRQTVLEKFDSHLVARQLEGVYQKALS